MTNGTPCPDCKSPSINNPCWYFLNNQRAADEGWDPPCYGAQDAARWSERQALTRKRKRIGRTMFAVAFVLVLAVSWWFH